MISHNNSDEKDENFINGNTIFLRLLEIDKKRLAGVSMSIADIPSNYTATTYFDLMIEELTKSFKEIIDDGGEKEKILYIIDSLILSVEVDLADPVLINIKSTNDYFLKKLMKLKHLFSFNAPSAPKIEKQLPKILEKSIRFSNNEIIEVLHSLLKGYFENSENELLKVLKGQPIERLLLFPSNQNKFVEVFKRAKYNGFILSSSTEIKSWICSNFIYTKTKGASKTLEKFNPNSVWDILTKDKGQPKPSERICVCDILPFKSYSQRNRET
ncbi:hypothetical protein KYG33_07845 [Chryseobacterium sp. D764]|uniref:hypothetical protein n=1 Tax=Chryseobacterium sp. D764 TaxID=2856522 RepID=UPI001C5A45D2|nr:hypothetical protein [Chryseobacterium sp. D764]QXU50946.1 hypothetical protein KYG33_07845 [Chryseobacterium sp. D764]